MVDMVEFLVLVELVAKFAFGVPSIVGSVMNISHWAWIIILCVHWVKLNKIIFRLKCPWIFDQISILDEHFDFDQISILDEHFDF